MAKPRKGVVPPQLRPFLFKKGRRPKHAATASAVTPMARRRRGRGKGRRVGQAALPLIPTLVVMAPEIMAGAEAAVNISRGANAAVEGGKAFTKIQALYGAGPAQTSAWEGVPLQYDVATNITAKVIGAATHLLMRRAGLRVRLTKRLTLF